jgi:hypothetical protein
MMAEGVGAGVECIECRHANDVLVSRATLITPSLHVISRNTIVRSGHSISNRSSRSRGELAICQKEGKAWQHVARVVVTGTRASIFERRGLGRRMKWCGEMNPSAKSGVEERSRVERRYVSLGYGMAASGWHGRARGEDALHARGVGRGADKPLRDHDV